MDHHDHVALLKPGIRATGGVWADLGSGSGAFTLALAELLGPEGTIYSVDRDRRALAAQVSDVVRRYPQTTLHPITADFTSPLDLPPLDGLVMANSLHFVCDKAPVVRNLRELLKPGGSFILVEYNVDRGNHWVPFPLSFTTWTRLAAEVGFTATALLGSRPSRFLHEIYSALSS
jgi:SAM-dependent methyltransferase